MHYKDDLSDISNFKDKESVLNITINNIHKIKKNSNNNHNRKKNTLKKEVQTIALLDIEINYIITMTMKMKIIFQK